MFVAKRYVSRRRAHRPRCAVRRITDNDGSVRPLPTRRRGGLPRPPGVGRRATLLHLTHVAPTPQSRRFAPRQLPFQGSRGVGGGLRRLCICLPRCGYLCFASARKGRRPRRPAVAGLPGWIGCKRLAWPIAPTFDTAHPPPSTAPRIRSRGRSPRTIGATRRTHVVRHPAEGVSGTPPPTVGARHTLLRVG